MLLYFVVFFTFVQNPKNVTLYVFCFVAYVFSNYDSRQFKDCLVDAFSLSRCSLTWECVGNGNDGGRLGIESVPAPAGTDENESVVYATRDRAGRGRLR